MRRQRLIRRVRSDLSRSRRSGSDLRLRVQCSSVPSLLWRRRRGRNRRRQLGGRVAHRDPGRRRRLLLSRLWRPYCLVALPAERDVGGDPERRGGEGQHGRGREDAVLEEVAHRRGVPRHVGVPRRPPPRTALRRSPPLSCTHARTHARDTCRETTPRLRMKAVVAACLICSP